jgi:hypothetical protein
MRWRRSASPAWQRRRERGDGTPADADWGRCARTFDRPDGFIAPGLVYSVRNPIPSVRAASAFVLASGRRSRISRASAAPLRARSHGSPQDVSPPLPVTATRGATPDNVSASEHNQSSVNQTRRSGDTPPELRWSQMLLSIVLSRADEGLHPSPVRGTPPATGDSPESHSRPSDAPAPRARRSGTPSPCTPAAPLPPPTPSAAPPPNPVARV